MAVRNFWVDANIDGRENNISGGPRNRGGGFNAAFYIREEGEIKKAATVRGTAKEDILTITIEPHCTVNYSLENNKIIITSKR